MKFQCVDECSQCCIKREYYPTKQFGKIGVLILAEEKQRIEKLAKQNNINIVILPRIGISNEKKIKSIKILAYQLMGIEENGDTCPFLDTNSGKRSPHGGYPCKIYNQRPLACMTYPLIELKPMQIDDKCKFCKEHGNANENLNEEIESLLKIKEKMTTDSQYIWRYATGVGECEDKEIIKTGWMLEK